MNNYELGNVLLALLLLMLGANVLGQLFTKMRQPKVVGEILAGILLGPTLLGKVAPGFAAELFGADSQACGFWLDYVLGKGWPLLSGDDLRRRGIEPSFDEELPRRPELVGVDAHTEGNGETMAKTADLVH